MQRPLSALSKVGIISLTQQSTQPAGRECIPSSRERLIHPLPPPPPTSNKEGEAGRPLSLHARDRTEGKIELGSSDAHGALPRRVDGRILLDEGIIEAGVEKGGGRNAGGGARFRFGPRGKIKRGGGGGIDRGGGLLTGVRRPDEGGGDAEEGGSRRAGDEEGAGGEGPHRCRAVPLFDFRCVGRVPPRNP